MAVNQTQQYIYDAFLSHCSADKQEVELLAVRLEDESGLKLFFDKWHLVPGMTWQEELEKALDTSATCVVILGPSGLGPWENEEMRAALEERVSNDSFRVIPVLLPNAEPKDPKTLPRFLRRLTWVDFRAGLNDSDAFSRLVAGIRGVAPGRKNKIAKPPAKWTLVLSGTIHDMDKARVEAITAHLRQISGDMNLTIQKIEEGSIKLYIESTLEAFDRISYVYQAGQSQMLNREILGVKLIREEDTPGQNSDEDKLISALIDYNLPAVEITLRRMNSEDAVLYLIWALLLEDGNVRAAASWAIREIGFEAEMKAIVPVLIERMKDQDKNARSMAVQTLQAIADWATWAVGFEAEMKAIVPALIEGMKDQDKNIRSIAAKTLQTIFFKWDRNAALPAFISEPEDQDGKVRSDAAQALQTMGFESEAKAPLFALIAMLQDQNENVRSIAAGFLSRFGLKAAVLVLIGALQAEDENVRCNAAQALGQFKAKAAVQSLWTALKDQSANVRAASAWAIGEIGFKTKAAVQVLVAALEDQDENVRSNAAQALGRFKAKAAVPFLWTALKDQSANVRAASAWAIGEIGFKANAALPALIAALEDQDENVRSKAAWAIGRVDSGRKVAAPTRAVVQDDGLEDKDNTVTDVAGDAIRRTEN